VVPLLVVASGATPLWWRRHVRAGVLAEAAARRDGLGEPQALE